MIEQQLGSPKLFRHFNGEGGVSLITLAQTPEQIDVVLGHVMTESAITAFVEVIENPAATEDQKMLAREELSGSNPVDVIVEGASALNALGPKFHADHRGLIERIERATDLYV